MLKTFAHALRMVVLSYLLISGMNFAFAASGSISALPTSCVIPTWDDHCNLNFTWNITGASSPNVLNTATGYHLAWGASGTSQSLPIIAGTNIIQATDDDTPVASVSVTGTCEAGSRWNGGYCYSPDTTYGSLSSSVSSCTIAIGTSTCNIPFTWSITNASFPNMEDYTTLTIYTTNPSGTNVPYPITYGQNRIKIRENGTYLAQLYVTGNCAFGSTWNGTICAADPAVNLVVTSIVCSSEALLPNWDSLSPHTGPDIASTTATNYVAAHPGCSLTSGWSFQWGYNNANSLQRDFIGEADGSLGAGTFTNSSDWRTFGPSNGSGVATVSIPINGSEDIHVREVLQSGYKAFTHDQQSVTPYNTVSPEFWCDTNVEEYDNWDFVWNARQSTGNTYYCIAFNVLDIATPTISASFTSPDINSGTNYSLNWTSTDASTITASCTGNASSSIQSLTFTPIGGGARNVATDNTMVGTTTCSLVANGTGGTATSSPFSLHVNPTCPATAPWNGSTCFNPAPSVAISPMSKTITINQAFNYTITSSDTGNDLDFTKLQWKAPGQSQWNYENSSYGATVTPNDGYDLYSPRSTSSSIFSFTPTVPGTYIIVATVRDNTSSRWTSTTTTALVVNCPAGYNEISGDCFNPLPTVSISPSGTQFIQLGTSALLKSTSTDASSDIVAHNLTWEKPNGEDRYAGAGQWGTVSYSASSSIPAGVGSSVQQATFTPDHVGYYRVRFAAQDNTLSNYNGEGPRWTYSSWTIIGVVNGTTATIIQDPANTNKIKWECFNSNLATMVTTGGSTTNDFTDKSLPPSSGTFTANAGATYTLTCKNTSTGQTSTAQYAKPTLTASNIGVTSVDLAYDCRNPAAASMVLERTPGTTATYNTASGTRTDTGLTGGTEYTYTLRCFSGPNGTGSQVGTITTYVNTIIASPPAFTISAYIQRTNTDPSIYSATDPISTITPDGQFHAWSYRITGGVASSCSMDQRNDNSPWYPSPGYVSDPTGYTLNWSSLTAFDKAGFASSFTNNHYWRLTCIDNIGQSASLIWSLQKSGAFPSVVDATLNLNCTPLPVAPTITVQCANSDYYEVRNNATNALISGVSGTTGTVSIPNTDATYRVSCKLGGASGTSNTGQYLRTYAGSMCGTSVVSFTATPRTIKAGSISTLQWNISQPTASCTLTAAPVCIGTCSAALQLDADALNAKIQSENTDTNDPNSINGELRTITNALQQEAFNNGRPGNAIGKKSLRINHTTDFNLNCGTSTTPQKVRVQVTNENQG